MRRERSEDTGLCIASCLCSSDRVECTNLSVRVTCSVVMVAATLAAAASKEAARL